MSGDLAVSFDGLGADIAAVCDRSIAKRDTLLAALDDYWAFCEHVQTLYENPATRQFSHKAYPTGWQFLRDYHEAYNLAYENGQDFVCVKGRRLMATYDPLVDWLFRAVRHKMRGQSPWMMAVLRQTETDAKLLIERVQGIYDRLPQDLRPEVDKRTTEEFRIGESVLRALHAQGDAGRGEPWNRVLFDEHAFQTRGQSNWDSFAVAMQKMSVSTPNGDNHFKDLARIRSGKVVVYDLGWEKHPERDDTWAEAERERLGEKVWLVEHCRRFDVYAEPGLLSDDFHEDCVVDVVPGTEARHKNWDGQSPIIISIDPGKVDGAGASIRYFNEHLQDVRLASFYRQGLDTDEFAAEVCGYAKARWPDADWLLTGDPAAEQERPQKTRYNEHCDKLIIERVASSILADCEYSDEGRCIHGRPIPMQFHRLPRGAGSRKARHQIQRAGFRLRHDKRRGTLIVRSENEEFLRGCRGAYKLPPNATARQMQYETPDRSLPCVHVVDADGCGLAQFSKHLGAAITAADRRYRQNGDHIGVSATKSYENWNSRFGGKPKQEKVFANGRFVH